MTATPAAHITQLLHAWSAGDERALDQLMPLVYAELRRLAQRYMRHERPGHTLQTTALVNEAYLRLVDAEVLHVSPETVMHDWKLAKAWLRRAMGLRRA